MITAGFLCMCTCTHKDGRAAVVLLMVSKFAAVGAQHKQVGGGCVGFYQ